MTLSYRQIADDLAANMRPGLAGEPPVYPHGSQLPSTTELAAIYGVHRSTIVRAVALLHDRGLIHGQQGRGMFVGKPTAD